MLQFNVVQPKINVHGLMWSSLKFEAGPSINVEHKKSNLTEILTDGIILEKNLILLKNLNGLNRNELGGKEPVFIDVWPVSILDSDQILTDGHFDFDESSLFLLQLGKYQKISRKSITWLFLFQAVYEPYSMVRTVWFLCVMSKKLPKNRYR